MSLAGWLRLGFILLAAGVLELACRLGLIDHFSMIPPSEMVAGLGDLLASKNIGPDIGFTFVNTIAAIALAITVGFIAGIVVHALPRLRRVITPLLSAYYAVPSFVFYPVLIVLLGLNRLPLIAIGALLGLVGMMVSTLDGLDRIPEVFLKTAQSYRMTPLGIAFRIKLPAAGLQLFTGVKLAVTYAVIGTIAGEFILSVAGLGRRLAIAYNDLDNRTMYALLLLVLSAVTLLNLLIFYCERRLQRRWSRR